MFEPEPIPEKPIDLERLSVDDLNERSRPEGANRRLWGRVKAQVRS